MKQFPIPSIPEDFAHALRESLSDVRFDWTTRLLYSTDASLYQMIPVGVAVPRDADEISAAVKIAAAHRVPILPRGGGSSLAGQAVNHALVLDLSRHLDRIVEIDPEARTATVQPGITLGRLNRELREYGLAFGPDPASGDRATVGGVLANNATGAHSIIYGMAADHVLSVEVILSDGSRTRFEALTGGWKSRGQQSGLEGEIYRAVPDVLKRYAYLIATRYPRVFRHVAGYNLNRLAAAQSPNLAELIAGSEGTLGIISEAALNLVPVPKVKWLVLVHYAEIGAALAAVPAILGSDPYAVEMVDRMLLDLTRGRLEYKHLLTFIEGDPEAVLMVEYAGDDERLLADRVEALKNILTRDAHSGSVVVVKKPADQNVVWAARKVGLGILMSNRGDAKPIPTIEDAAVPVEHLADYVQEIGDYAQAVGVGRMAVYAHASAGCMHIRPVVNIKTDEGIRQMRQIAGRSAELVLKYGGTTSGEHGEGIARGEFSKLLFGPELIKAFREVKHAFDPGNLMNPGKMFDAPPMDDQSLLRYGSDYATPYELTDTVFSFEADGGFAGAVEMCNGAAVCRQLDDGVMCPSFQATRDEAHSTRGRANMLRAAMMGLLGPDGMTSRGLYDVLDLCLSCHACKSECPSAVDMARLKAEFLFNYQQEHGVPIRSWLFGNIAQWDQIAQPFALLANRVFDGPGKLALSALGIHPEREFPRYAPKSFSRQFREDHGEQPGGAIRKPVVLFHDTFMEHNDPQIGQAAVKVLEAAGYTPILLKEKKCCGRPAVSKGLLKEAVRLARHNVGLLAPYVREGVSIVGCEPSCMAMLADEYRDLAPGEESRLVAEGVSMIDAFLFKELSAGQIGLTFDGKPRRVLFHGHCQQKSIFGIKETVGLLRMIPNCTVEVIESGCCGMAGSFGYEKEHYDLSIQLAEMSLAPAIRAAAPETIICAAGTSCREQIAHTTGRRALHPIEVLAEALVI
ncbi:MAG: FAD-binding protein [Anaerolineae bacterium]|nr:FAD-binding protein [Anaerolineae bacterium]